MNPSDPIRQQRLPACPNCGSTMPRWYGPTLFCRGCNTERADLKAYPLARLQVCPECGNDDPSTYKPGCACAPLACVHCGATNAQRRLMEGNPPLCAPEHAGACRRDAIARQDDKQERCRHGNRRRDCQPCILEDAARAEGVVAERARWIAAVEDLAQECEERAQIHLRGRAEAWARAGRLARRLLPEGEQPARGEDPS